MEQAEKIKILQDLIRIHSVNGNELAVAQYLQQLFNAHGITDVALIPFNGAQDRCSMIVEIGNHAADKVLALAGHMDTVAVGATANWQFDPFSGQQVGDTIYGRGAADMKSGLAAMVIAVIEIKEANVPLTGRLRFIGTAGEELGARGAVELTQQGRIHDVTAMVVGEPTGGNIVYAHSGQFNYRVKSYGKSAHSSLPATGINAIYNLNEFITAERTAFIDAPKSQLLGNLEHSITVIQGGDQINSIPDYAQLEGNIRPIPEFNTQQVLDRLQSIITTLNQQPQVKLVLQVIDRFEALANDPDAPFVQQLQAARTAAFGTPAQKLIIHGATDASAYVADNACPMLLLGAGDWQVAHQVDEAVSIDNYLKVITTYKNIVRSYL
ncbi:ArgE/DapE family deacylase [Loigolactobacillus jiayinensis]|uniref:Probable succinyl-diaminopimelate desuccinylase n=1 Tax=Loigolactobacillus jiayinensis TaxID=2486016 RepID=A0ABW1RBL1_9LACO|nr:ArgE/DapE family deacylase [Loigolactobacillus jiayinensis]